MPKERYFADALDDEAEDDLWTQRRSRLPRKQQAAKGSPDRLLAELSGITGQEDGFTTTYQPARFEEGWLLSSLRVFYDQQLITDVLAQVKGGKEDLWTRYGVDDEPDDPDIAMS